MPGATRPLILGRRLDLSIAGVRKGGTTALDRMVRVTGHVMRDDRLWADPEAELRRLLIFLGALARVEVRAEYVAPVDTADIARHRGQRPRIPRRPLP
jgi:hypothetical protein